jgi:Relaxase/Mobilisation nuclease domain
VPSDGPALFDIVSFGRWRPEMPGRFSLAQIAHISRTVSSSPEVMVKVTGGGTGRGAVGAHFGYISRRGALEIETDEGEFIGYPEQQKQLLDEWHLELTAGQYRREKEGGPARRWTKLVHNIVLAMPAPTPADKVLAAARKFAREKFAHHRYAMVLHTDQKHPHVHLVVKAENELGRRLHIDKQRLRVWREDFARLMREQGIAANATSRAVRGENKKFPREKIFKAQRYGTSTALHDRVNGIAQGLSRSRTIADPARGRLLETRKSLVSAWMKVADVLDAQGEIILAGDVRYFVKHLPTVLTDRQKLAAEFIGFIKKQREIERDGPERLRPKDPELTR